MTHDGYPTARAEGTTQRFALTRVSTNDFPTQAIPVGTYRCDPPCLEGGCNCEWTEYEIELSTLDELLALTRQVCDEWEQVALQMREDGAIRVVLP